MSRSILSRTVLSILPAPLLAAPAPAAERAVVPYPAEVAAPEWVETRRARQLESLDLFETFIDFSFADRREETGITFANVSTSDTGKRYKASHYDHGNGIAVADADGDGLLDIYFSNMAAANELWRNAGSGGFEAAPSEVLALSRAIGVAASFADIDNDGDPDLFATTIRGGNHLFENRGQAEFADVTRRAGLQYEGHSSAAVFFDYDLDGLLDLFVANVGVFTTETVVTAPLDALNPETPGEYSYFEAHPDAFAGHLKPERNEPSILYRNRDGSAFEDVTSATGLVDSSWAGAATPIDADEDGWTDLYVLDMQGHDEYFENRGGKRFVRKSREVFPRTPWGSMGVKVFDWDNDGMLDLYISDMHSDMSAEVGPWDEKWKASMQFPESFLLSGGMSLYGNAFYRKTGPGRYEEISDAVGAENYWPWGLSTGDLNADGFEDVFLASSMNYPFRYGVNTVLINNRGAGFLDSEYLLGVEPRKEGVTSRPWFHLDCGGADAGHKHCEGQEGEVEVWASVGTRSSAVFDIDGDGDLDIVTNEFNDLPMVLVSDLSERREIGYLQVSLRGNSSNRDGLGARVDVTAGGRRFTKVNDGQSGYLSQSSLPLYFGLGGADRVDLVEVTWPGGGKQSLAGVDGNRTIVIEENQ